MLASSIDSQVRIVFRRTDQDYLLELVQRLSDASCFMRSTYLPTRNTVLAPTQQSVCDGYGDVTETEVPHWRESAGTPAANGETSAPSSDEP